jgi:hypothetical protein
MEFSILSENGRAKPYLTLNLIGEASPISLNQRHPRAITLEILVAINPLSKYEKYSYHLCFK